MSWYGNTLMPVVQEVACDDAPTTVLELVSRCEAVDPQVARFVAAKYTDSTLPELYEWARVDEVEEAS